MSTPAAPDAFVHLTDLSLDATGTFVLHATDDYFASADRLLLPDAPEWREGAYTSRGKWMDGWESQRRRTSGHDAVVMRLGTPGRIEGVLCETTHFKGNAPQSVSLEALEAAPTTPVAELLGLPVVQDAAGRDALGGRAWLEIVPRTEIAPDARNVLVPARTLARATHVRLRIHPDGGVARLRIYGHVAPEPDLFWGEASVDLAALASGGRIAAISDAFFGPPVNLLLPGRGVSMGDGWETRRRRTPGSDWCVIALARRGVLEAIELDTHFFKGNAPIAARLEGLDADGLAAEELQRRLAGQEGWIALVDRVAIAPHHRHRIVPARAPALTHLRVHILPHGGVNRLRAFGRALDTPGERAALAALAAQPAAARRETLLGFCGAAAYADAFASRLPAAGVRELFAASAAAFATLTERDLLEAFSRHPVLGESAAPEGAAAGSAAMSRREQGALAGADADQRQRLAELNRAYRERFGFVFLAFASGRSADDILASLEARLGHDRAEELDIAAGEQARITRARLGRWLVEHGAA